MKKSHIVLIVGLFITQWSVTAQEVDLPGHPGFHLEMLKEIASAKPTEEIDFMDAPLANSQGTANLTYPIKLPPGRRNMEPDVEISYDSENGMSWCGLGWDVVLPAITIDTRWGVPRYDDQLETETYLVEGRQLAPVAHRGNLQNRESDKQFYLRVEDQFDKIIRHGNNPRNYWWELISPTGIKRYYGGHPKTGVSDQAVLRDADGNIGHWALTQRIDHHGNTINYSYSIVRHAGVAGASLIGQNIYVDEVNYTGFEERSGPFVVRFIRDRQLGEAERQDIGISARLGFKQVSADLLRHIEILYNNSTIRSYELNYAMGPFNKTLLKDIICLDQDGMEFYRHSMDYFDDVRIGGQYYPFGDRELWNGQHDNITGGLVGANSLFPDNGALLGGSYSSDWSLGGAATVGLIGDLLTKINTAGANYNYGRSTGEGRIAFVDINGDGLADKVYRKNGKLYYRPNQHLQFGSEFGHERPISGISQFSKATTTSHAIGAEAHPGLGFVGYSNNKITTNITTYFSDFNADGLIDVVFDGIVYFNQIDSNGDPLFTTQSTNTPSPISIGEPIDDNLIVVDPDEQEELIDASPLHDVVRMWEAPYDGNVRINAPVRLIEDLSQESQAYKHKDGVRVAIQVGGNEAWSTVIGPDDFIAKTPTGVANIFVREGDRIYFRVQSNFDGAYDQVIWDPVVEYVGQNTASLDATANPFYSFKASDDFILASCQTVTMPLDGIIDIEGKIKKPFLSDDIYVRINRTDTEGNVSTLSAQDYRHDVEADEELIFRNLRVDSGDVLSFQINCFSNVSWASVSWTPIVSYVSADNGTTVIGQNGQPLVSFCPAPEYQIYSKVIERSSIYTVPESGQLEITERLDFPFFLNGLVYISVKKEKDILGRQSILVVNGTASQNNPLVVDVEAGDELFIEYHTPNPDLGNQLQSAGVRLRLNGQTDNIIAGFHTKRNDDDIIFGPMYRNWGLFAYNGNRDRANRPINEDELMIDEGASDVADGAGDIDDPDDIGDTYSNANEPFVLLVSDVKNRYWIGTDNLTYIKNDTVSSSRMGEDNVLPPSFENDGGTLTMPAIKSVSRINSIAGGASVGPIGAGGSVAFNTTRNEIDVIDLNGDSYPDIVTDVGIQYTNMRGGLESNLVSHSFGHHEARSFGWGISSSVDFVHSSATNSGDASQGQASNGKRGGVKSKGSRKAKNASKIRRGGRAKSTVNKSSKKSKDSSRASQNGIGIDVGFTNDRDTTTRTWTDINGDGLVDLVYDNGRVALNLGYSFSPVENWGFDGIRAGFSRDLGGGLGINLFNGSIVSGLSINRTDNFTELSLQDVNGDGMVDLITGIEPLTVKLNTGNGFASPIRWNGANHIEQGSATGESVNVAFTVCIPIVILGIKICVNPSSSLGQGMSRVTQQLADADGDGFVDYLESTTDNELFVRRSAIGRTNLLKSVSRPLGGVISLDYINNGNSYDLPYSRWVLSSVEMNDGIPGDGADRTRVAIDYNGGYFDRNEREFYGFQSVRIHELNTEKNNALYRTVVMQYSVNNYYEKGLQIGYEVRDAQGRPYIIENKSYQLTDVLNGTPLPPTAAQDDAGMAFPALHTHTQSKMEGDPAMALHTTRTYAYNAYGHIIQCVNTGDGRPEDELLRQVEYHHDDDLAIHHIPAQESWTANGQIIRQTIQKVDADGNIAQRQEWISDANYAVSDFDFDEFGNIKEYVRPKNKDGQRLTYNYVHDADVHTYITEITDSYELHSSQTFDVRYGKLIEQTAINQESISIELDTKGRLQKIKGPDDQDETDAYALSFDYNLTSTPAMAETRRFNPDYDEDIITVVYSDGFGRVIQTQRQGVVAQTNGASQSQIIVSGKDHFDAFGRTVATHYPSVLPSQQFGFTSAPDAIEPSRYTWDLLDRPLSIISPDNVKSSHAYTMSIDNFGQLGQVTIRTDALGHSRYSFKDIKGQVRAKKDNGPFGEIWTNFDFNALSEMTRVTDTENHETNYYYDGLGRQIEIIHPDAGIRKYNYDNTGNLIEKISSKITDDVENDGHVIYTHDYERLVEINYPKNYHNKVQLHYGTPEDPYNRIGRVWLREDASGGEEYFYGKLGEVEKCIRTVLVHRNNMQTYISTFDYDNWGRIRSMTYPDGEQVAYGYNRSGRLNTISGLKTGVSYDYILDVAYDKFDLPVAIAYGNGVSDRITYDPLRRTTDNLEIRGDANLPLLQLAFSYDSIDHITSQVWKAGEFTHDLGGDLAYNYSYDKLGRLQRAMADFNGINGQSQTFEQELVYDDLHNILSKKMIVYKQDKLQADKSYENKYDFDGQQPHAPSTVSGRTMSYDQTGNLTQVRGKTAFEFKQFKWDEENRLSAVSNNGYISRFTYDGQGERIIASHGGMQGVFIDGETAGIVDHVDNYTITISPFFTAEKDQFQKHYFFDGRRFLTKTGNGQFNFDVVRSNELETAGRRDYLGRRRLLEQAQDEYYKELGIPPGAPTLLGLVAQPEFTGDALPNNLANSYNQIPPGWPRAIANPDTSGAPGHPIYYESTADSSFELAPGYAFDSTGTDIYIESDVAYYHQDHLGTANLITNFAGEVVEYRAYAPFGEIFIEQTASENAKAYKFNGKKYDEHTEMYYFGARYFDPKYAIWTNVDPFVDVFPSWSPYAYTFQNPVNYVDSDGKLPGAPYLSPDDAAKNFAKEFNPASIMAKKEFASTIYYDPVGGYYSYTSPVMGTEDGVDPPQAPRRTQTVADVHTHANYSPKYKSDVFSDADIDGIRDDGHVGYVATPRGRLLKFDPFDGPDGTISTISRKVPADPNHPKVRKSKRQQKQFRKRTKPLKNKKAALHLGTKSSAKY